MRGDVEGAELYLRTFCEMSDTEKQYVKKWLPLVSAVQLLNGKAEEKELLMRWIEAADYK